MDAIPEKFYYVPLPRPPRLGMPDLPRPPRLPRLPMPGLALSATIDAGRRRWRRGRRVAATWWASHTLDAALWTLAIAFGVVLGLVLAQV
jgi:hypothetical protein